MEKFGKKKHKNLPRSICSMLPTMYGIDSYSARPKNLLTMKNLVCKYLNLGQNGWQILILHQILCQNTNF